MNDQPTLHSARISWATDLPADVILAPIPPAFRSVHVQGPSLTYRTIARVLSLPYVVRTTGADGRLVAVVYRGARAVEASEYVPSPTGAAHPLTLPFPWRTIPLPS